MELWANEPNLKATLSAVWISNASHIISRIFSWLVFLIFCLAGPFLLRCDDKEIFFLRKARGHINLMQLDTATPEPIHHTKLFYRRADLAVHGSTSFSSSLWGQVFHFFGRHTRLRNFHMQFFFTLGFLENRFRKINETTQNQFPVIFKLRCHVHSPALSVVFTLIGGKLSHRAARGSMGFSPARRYRFDCFSCNYFN